MTETHTIRCVTERAGRLPPRGPAVFRTPDVLSWRPDRRCSRRSFPGCLSYGWRQSAAEGRPTPYRARPGPDRVRAGYGTGRGSGTAAGRPGGARTAAPGHSPSRAVRRTPFAAQLGVVNREESNVTAPPANPTTDNSAGSQLSPPSDGCFACIIIADYCMLSTAIWAHGDYQPDKAV